MMRPTTEECKKKDRSCLYTFITIFIIAVIIICLFLFIPNKEGLRVIDSWVFEEISNYDFDSSYELHTDTILITDLSIPLIQEQYKIEATGNLRNNKKKNTFKITFTASDVESYKYEYDTITRTLDKNESYEFKFTLYLDFRPKNYDIKITER